MNITMHNTSKDAERLGNRANDFLQAKESQAFREGMESDLPLPKRVARAQIDPEFAAGTRVDKSHKKEWLTARNGD
jgi:hypothetical protein